TSQQIEKRATTGPLITFRLPCVRHDTKGRSIITDWQNGAQCIESLQILPTILLIGDCVPRIDNHDVGLEVSNCAGELPAKFLALETKSVWRRRADAHKTFQGIAV